MIALRAFAAVWLLLGAGAGEKPEFWAKREQAYRESMRGPFTAIDAHYLDRGDSVTLAVREGKVVAADEGDGEDSAGPALRIELVEAGFRAVPVAGFAPATLGGRDLTEPVELAVGAGDEEDLRLGALLLSLRPLESAQGRVLVYDPALLERFHGFSVFEDTDAFRVEARVLPGDGAPVELGTTRGLIQTYVTAAALEFQVAGTPCRLTAFRSPGDEGATLFVPYRDGTSGGASYGAARYLRVEPREDGTATIDFNRSTNPWCAYSPFYNCVLPPEENTLSVEIRAGERAPADH